MFKTVLEEISQLKQPIKCLLKTSRNPWTNICFRFFDLTNACVINHEILLAMLEYYGIRGTIKAWIESYLTHWLQFVEIVKTDKENTKRYIFLCIRK